MKNLSKNIPSGLFKKAYNHLDKAKNSILFVLFSNEDWENIELIERKFEAIKNNG